MNEPNALLTLVTPQTVRLKQNPTGWREALALAGGLLTAQGLVSESYVEQCIQAAGEMGPYFVVCPGVALSHARPGEEVRQLCLATVTLEPPIPFGHAYNDPVSLLFLFGSCDAQAHLELLKGLGKVLSDGEALKKLAAADSFAELHDTLRAALGEGGTL